MGVLVGVIEGVMEDVGVDDGSTRGGSTTPRMTLLEPAVAMVVLAVVTVS